MGSHRNDRGFTLVEAALAVTLAAFIIAVLGVMLASTLRAIGERRLEQSAAVLAVEVLEEARSTDYDDLEHDAADATLSGAVMVDPDGPGPAALEALVMEAGGLSPAVYTRTLNQMTFTITRYITWVDENPADSDTEDFKRVSVSVTWTSRGIAREHRSEALISELGTLGSTSTTIPIGPASFDLTPDNPTVIGIQDTEVVVGFTLTNTGPDERFNFYANEPVGASYIVVFHQDLNGNGAKDAGDNPLVDTNSDAKVDSGFTPIATGASFDLLAVWTPTTSDPPGTSSILVSAETLDTSATDTSTVDFTLNPVAVAAGLFYLHNRPTPPTGNTSAQKDLDMDSTAPTASNLYNYSTNKDSDPGRFVDKDGSAGTTNSDKMVNWVWQLSNTTNYSGTAQVTIWVAMKDFNNDKSAGVRVLLRHKGSATTGSGTTIGDVTQVHNGSGGFEQMTFNIPVNTTIAGGQFLEVKVLATGSSDDAIYVAFDTTGHPSKLVMP